MVVYAGQVRHHGDKFRNIAFDGTGAHIRQYRCFLHGRLFFGLHRQVEHYALVVFICLVIRHSGKFIIRQY